MSVRKSERKQPTLVSRYKTRLWVAAIISNTLLLGVIAAFVWYQHRPLFSLKINKVQTTDQSVAVFQVEPGYTFAIIDIALTPRTKTPIWVTPVTQSYLLDEHGKTYSMAPYALEQPFVADVYNPGQTIRGQLSYKIPAGVHSVKFCYRLSTDTSCQNIAL